MAPPERAGCAEASRIGDVPSVDAGWFRFPRALGKNQGAIPNDALRVALALLAYADEHGNAWPKLRTLTQSTGLSRSSVIRGVRWLEQQGWLQKVHLKDPTGEEKLVYRLHTALWRGGTTGDTPPVPPVTPGGTTGDTHVLRPIYRDPIIEKEYSSEPSKKASEPNHDEAAVLTFQCVGTGPSQWTLTASKLQQYREAFPGIDVLAECRKARQWLIDNPPRRKTAKGMPRFLNSWLSRAQDRAGRNGQPAPKPKAKTTNLPYLN